MLSPTEIVKIKEIMQRIDDERDEIARQKEQHRDKVVRVRG